MINKGEVDDEVEGDEKDDEFSKIFSNERVYYFDSTLMLFIELFLIETKNNDHNKTEVL